MKIEQKRLAQANKKGFTLVELVVVIAILAILAAIAIPAILSIVNSAGSSAGQSDASAVNIACKTYYASVKAGMINTESKNPDGTSVTEAAAKGAKVGDRNTAAKNATVAAAQKYSGINVTYDNLCYYTSDNSTTHNLKGDIVYYDGGVTTPTGTSKLTGSVRMSDLYC
ncbi:MAG: prepilin-type N-terminal cleavage/methylation domain-containing protein [Acutalibacteraceae bacterium]